MKGEESMICDHCWHFFRGASYAVLPDGHVVMKCCKCPATDTIHRDDLRDRPRPRAGVWPKGRSWCAGPLAFLLLALGGCDYSGRAADAAREYADGLGLQMSGVSCVRSDTDGDGYVSCTLAMPDGKLQPLECVGSPFTWNRGCRVPKAVFPGAR